MVSNFSTAVMVVRQHFRCRNTASVKGSFHQRNFSSFETSSKNKAKFVNAKVDTHLLYANGSNNSLGVFQKIFKPPIEANKTSVLTHSFPNHSARSLRSLRQHELMQPFISDNHWRYNYSRVPKAGNIFNLYLRSFSTKTGEPPEKKELTSGNDETKIEEDVVDKEFAEYLTGKRDEGVTSTPRTTTLIEELKSDITTAESANESNGTNANQESSSETQETKIQSQSTDEWFNSLLRNSKDLGRPTPEVNEQYRNIERKNLVKIEKSRERQITMVRRALGGNLIIAASKLAAFLHSGSSAILSEFIHSIVDCGNQSLLLIGLRDAGNEADRSHPYGYGKSIYFWALVSALGTFFLGAGVSMTQALPQLIYGGSLHEITWHVWGVLGFSFAVDGYVFTKTLSEVNADKPDNITLWKHVCALRDPATLAILLEDGAACLGIVMAIGGIAATQAFNTPFYDALAGVGISSLLATMGILLVRVNHRFLLGQAVDKDTRKGVEKILLNRRSIDNVNSIQSQWTGPNTFSYKAEVDFDGTFLAAKLIPRYQKEFAEAKDTLDQDLRVLLSWYAEDVMRTVEREVRSIEAEVRRKYPGAQYIELEPMSKDADRFAIDDGLEASLKRIEIESLNRYLKSLYQPSENTPSTVDKSMEKTKLPKES
eukprot:scaffold798_cov268-Chaetoceros_neogracile.AAC.15